MTVIINTFNKFVLNWIWETILENGLNFVWKSKDLRINTKGKDLDLGESGESVKRVGESLWADLTIYFKLVEIYSKTNANQFFQLLFNFNY